jgi:hypothetical protein
MFAHLKPKLAQPRRTILLLSGWPGSGKDAAASLLMEECGFTRYAFADRLRQEVSQRTGLPTSLFQSHGLKDEQLVTPCPLYPAAETPRDILRAHAKQALAAHPNCYSRAVAEAIREDSCARAVISDWRTLDELQVIQEAFPTAEILTIRITRARAAAPPSLATIEHELDAFPFALRIANDGTVSDLRDALHQVLRPLIHGTVGYQI